jgi:protein-S-isoprenylcysteine O-methyltransferase Ste14
MNIFLKWQKQDTPEKSRVGPFLIGALIFPTLIPFLLVLVLPLADKALGIRSFYSGWINIVIGIFAIITGFAIAIWTIVLQITRASGTPFPMLPTKRLLVSGPFKYCRNPMTLGTIVAYTGIAILIGSWSALVFVVVLAALLIAYLKFIEEKELLLRFGSEYEEYKKKTPFIIPIKIS